MLGFTEEQCDITRFIYGQSINAHFNIITNDGSSQNNEVKISCSEVYTLGGKECTEPGTLIFWSMANQFIYINGQPVNADKIKFDYRRAYLIINLIK